MGKKKALIVGASGIVGLNLANRLAAKETGPSMACRANRLRARRFCRWLPIF